MYLVCMSVTAVVKIVVLKLVMLIKKTIFIFTFKCENKVFTIEKICILMSMTFPLLLIWHGILHASTSVVEVVLLIWAISYFFSVLVRSFSGCILKLIVSVMA